MSDESYGDDAEELREQLAGFEFQFRKRCIRWLLQTMLGLTLFAYLSTLFPWGKWALSGYVVLSACSLGFMLRGRATIRSKTAGMLAELERLEQGGDRAS